MLEQIEMKLKFFVNRIRPGFFCEEPGCWERDGIMSCRLVVFSNTSQQYEDEFDFYCGEHASKNGYCWGCGEFWAGVEAFDFNDNQLCPNCKDDPDLTGYEDDEDDYFGSENPYDLSDIYPAGV